MPTAPRWRGSPERGVPEHLSSPQGEPFTDVANAERLVRAHGTMLCYVDAWRRWLVWDGTRWAPDAVRAIDGVAIDTLRALVIEASTLEDAKERAARIQHALRSESGPRLE